MKGDQRILDSLQNLLNMEIAGRDQYLAHSGKYLDWGLSKLHAQMLHEMEEEQTHIDAIVNRMLFLEGSPDYAQKEKPNVGDSVVEMLRNDLDSEIEVARMLREIIQLCEQLADYETRNILQTLLHDTEMDHIYWLEQQHGLIEKMGLSNYLQSQM